MTDMLAELDKCISFAKWARAEWDAGRLVHYPADYDAGWNAGIEAAAQFARDWMTDEDDAISLALNIRALSPTPAPEPSVVEAAKVLLAATKYSNDSAYGAIAGVGLSVGMITRLEYLARETGQ